jgi:hypothetical protein
VPANLEELYQAGLPHTIKAKQERDYLRRVRAELVAELAAPRLM